MRLGRNIFVSYRHDDSAYQAGRLKDRLQAKFEGYEVFLDVDGIPLGADIFKTVDEKMTASDALVVVIGPAWLDIRNTRGDRRLDDPNDSVRIEIATALKRGISIIPVLLDGTKKPSEEQLPAELQGFSRRKWLDLRYASFEADFGTLASELAKGLRQAREAAEARRELKREELEDAGPQWLWGTLVGLVVIGIMQWLVSAVLPIIVPGHVGESAAPLVTMALSGALVLVLRRQLLIWPMFLAAFIVGCLAGSIVTLVFAGFLLSATEGIKAAVCSLVVAAPFLFIRLERRSGPSFWW